MKAAAKHTTLSIPSQKTENSPSLPPETQQKINNFINELKSKDNDKALFLSVFSTLVRLKKDEKENFIAGVVQTIKSTSGYDSASLHDKFMKGLKRYMAISFMNQPFADQLNKNMLRFNIDGDNDDDDLDI